jgi:hypothetical protein
MGIWIQYALTDFPAETTGLEPIFRSLFLSAKPKSTHPFL